MSSGTRVENLSFILCKIEKTVSAQRAGELNVSESACTEVGTRKMLSRVLKENSKRNIKEVLAHTHIYTCTHTHTHTSHVYICIHTCTHTPHTERVRLEQLWREQK